jgi:putative colanic acid biosysnthesis UDP-glucose lipid carrier transferase
MNKRSVFYLRFFTDLFLLNASFIIAASIAQSFELFTQRTHLFVLLAILNFIWYFFSNVISFYDDFNTRHFSFQFTNILKITSAQIFTAVLFVFLVKEDLFTRNFIFIYGFLLILLISIRIPLMRKLIIKARGKENKLRNLIIIGAGEIGKNFLSMINVHKEFGFNFKGFVDDNQTGENITGSISRLDEILKKENVNEVVIALSIYDTNQLDEIIRICNNNAVRVHIIPDYFKYVSKKFRISMIGDFPIISVRGEPLAEAHWRFLKRSFDIIISIFVIVFILSWFLPVLFIMKKLFSKESIFFIQERVGADDKIFKCYKFRTMIENKEHYQPVTSDDQRITKTGRFLRRTNLDELPQFFNVFFGSMSVVGPRPHAIPYDNEYKKMVDEIRLRYWVKPGITGWAQIHGLRGDDTDYEKNKIRTKKRIEHDLWYIENWSFWLDIQIILLTVWQILKGESRGT